MRYSNTSNDNTILYIDPDKKRTDSWLSLNGLQLPVGESSYGSIRMVTYADGKVKVRNAKNVTAMQKALEAAGIVDAFGNIIKEEHQGRTSTLTNRDLIAGAAAQNDAEKIACRSAEQLGHTADKKLIEKILDQVIIEDGYYRCRDKNISMKEPKLREFCLKPGAKHSRDFFDIGYSSNDPMKLFRDIAEQFDISRKRDSEITDSHAEKFSIPMKLGITDKRVFRVVWTNDGPDKSFRFVTAYVDRKLKQEDD